MDIFTLQELGLSADATDAQIWIVCQENKLVLLTGNRNADGRESLETTIREQNSATCLPVVTFADLRKLKLNREYLEYTAERLMEVLLDIDALRGAGRLYIP